jgi:hypothetical protein
MQVFLENERMVLLTDSTHGVRIFALTSCGKIRKTACVSSNVGPRSAGHREQFVVHVDRVHPLVEKAEQAADGRTGRQRIAVAPDDVFPAIITRTPFVT